MTTVTVDIIDEKALTLLKDLEALKIIRMHYDERDVTKVDFAKYKGKMTKQPIEEVEKQLKELRGEWS
jgi:predicted transcriptional regulator